MIYMNKNLKLLRENSEYTQESIANILNITRQNYSRWETNELLIPLYHLNSLANLFDTSMDYIMGLTNKNHPTDRINNLNFQKVGNNIKEIRNDNNISMRTLAKILNTSHSSISNYEHGKNLIIISFALEISKKYNISLDWLCERSNKKYIEK